MCTQPQTAVPNGNSRGAHCCFVHQAEIFHWQHAQKTQRPDHVNDRCWVNSQRRRSKMSPSDTNKTNDSIKHKNSDVFPCLLLSRNTSKMLNESRSGLKTTASDVAAAPAWPAADRYEAFLTSLWTGSDCLWVLDPRRRSAFERYWAQLQVCFGVMLRVWPEHFGETSSSFQVPTDLGWGENCGQLQGITNQGKSHV